MQPNTFHYPSKLLPQNSLIMKNHLINSLILPGLFLLLATTMGCNKTLKPVEYETVPISWLNQTESVRGDANRFLAVMEMEKATLSADLANDLNKLLENWNYRHQVVSRVKESAADSAEIAKGELANYSKYFNDLGSLFKRLDSLNDIDQLSPSILKAYEELIGSIETKNRIEDDPNSDENEPKGLFKKRRKVRCCSIVNTTNNSIAGCIQMKTFKAWMWVVCFSESQGRPFQMSTGACDPLECPNF
jgi:hypothetical protein